MATFSVRSYRNKPQRRFNHKTHSIKIRGSSTRKSPQVFTFSKSLISSPKFRLIKGSAFGRFFKNQPSARVRIRVTPRKYSSRPFTRKVEFYSSLKFSNGRVRRIQLLSTEQSQTLVQDANYFIISKADLEKVGLVPRVDNSLEELVSALLIYWVNSLESNRITVSFYRYVKIEESSKWFELQSFLINLISTIPKGSFPSPDSLLI